MVKKAGKLAAWSRQHFNDLIYCFLCYGYSKRHNKFLFPALAEVIYGSSRKTENGISNVVNYSKAML